MSDCETPSPSVSPASSKVHSAKKRSASEDAADALKELVNRRKERDQFDSFGATVASLVRNLPDLDCQELAMINTLQMLRGIRLNAQSNFVPPPSATHSTSFHVPPAINPTSFQIPLPTPPATRSDQSYPYSASTFSTDTSQSSFYHTGMPQ